MITKKRTITCAAVSSLFLLMACSPAVPTRTRMLDDQLENPLFAERYYDELVENMVEIEIYENPLAHDPQKKRLIERTRKEGLENAKKANSVQNTGKTAALISMETYTKGIVLLTDTHLFFSSEFEIIPGVELHVFLTETVDPRDVTFPDETAVDLGIVQSAYGHQSYALPASMTGALRMRSIVLWDKALERLHGFGQLHSL